MAVVTEGRAAASMHLIHVWASKIATACVVLCVCGASERVCVWLVSKPVVTKGITFPHSSHSPVPAVAASQHTMKHIDMLDCTRCCRCSVGKASGSSESAASPVESRPAHKDENKALLAPRTNEDRNKFREQNEARSVNRHPIGILWRRRLAEPPMLQRPCGIQPFRWVVYQHLVHQANA